MAKLAGVPDDVVLRAKEILKELDTGVPFVKQERLPETEEGQLLLLPQENNDLLQRLKDLDVNVLTPIEAMQVLYELNSEAQKY